MIQFSNNLKQIARNFEQRERRIKQNEPSIVRAIAVPLLAYAKSVTHVDTGALQESHYIDYSDIGNGIAVIRSNESTTNSRTGQKPAVYGAYEHARGGDHAFYTNTVNEQGQRAIEFGIRALRQYL